MVEDSAPSGNRGGTDPDGTAPERKSINWWITIAMALAGWLVGGLAYVVYAQTAGSGVSLRYLCGISFAGLMIGWRLHVEYQRLYLSWRGNRWLWPRL